MNKIIYTILKISTLLIGIIAIVLAITSLSQDYTILIKGIYLAIGLSIGLIYMPRLYAYFSVLEKGDKQ